MHLKWAIPFCSLRVRTCSGLIICSSYQDQFLHGVIGIVGGCVPRMVRLFSDVCWRRGWRCVWKRMFVVGRGREQGRVITLPWTTTWPAGFHAFHVPELLKYPRLPSRSLLHTNPHLSAHNVHQDFYPTRPHPPRLSLRRLRSAMVPLTPLPKLCPVAHPHILPATPLRTALRLLHAAVSFPNSTTCQRRVLTFRPSLSL